MATDVELDHARVRLFCIAENDNLAADRQE